MNSARTNRYLNNLIEQDHRGIKQRYGPMKSFVSFKSAALFCRAHGELRNYYKTYQRGGRASLRDQRINYKIKTQKLMNDLMRTA